MVHSQDFKGDCKGTAFKEKKLDKYSKMWFNYAVILLIEKYNRRKKVTESHIVCKLWKSNEVM